MKVQGTLGRLALVAALGLFGVVAAFATIAPSGESADLPPSTVLTESIPLRLDEMRLAPPQWYVREERFQRGETLAGLFSRLGIEESAVRQLIRVRALAALRPGSTVTAEVGAEGALQALSFLTAHDRLVRIEPSGNGFHATAERPQLETRVAMKSGVVRSSLFAATDGAGIPDSIAGQLADIFGGDVDFHRDLRKGDRFSVIYEVQEFDGRPLRAGRMLAAEFVNQGRTYRAIRFGSGYYTPAGKNLRKAFLRSPLEFSRVSSGFGMRMHPFLQSWRAHKGIDYAAPVGTRVRAVADAVVDYAGPKGGYGNVVILRHQGQYMTVYAHLSRVAVRRGARVAQNDTIGFVGRTGWATGPHLHYEFRIAGQARNPFSVALPAALPLPEAQMAAFASQAGAMVDDLNLLESSNLALLD